MDTRLDPAAMETVNRIGEARTMKANALAKVLINVTPVDGLNANDSARAILFAAMNLPKAGWVTLAEMVGVTPPSAETITLILSHLHTACDLAERFQ